MAVMEARMTRTKRDVSVGIHSSSHGNEIMSDFTSPGPFRHKTARVTAVVSQKQCSHVALHFETFTQICVNLISSHDLCSQVVGWVGTSNNLLRNLCFTRPVDTPSLLYGSEPALESIDPAV